MEYTTDGKYLVSSTRGGQLVVWDYKKKVTANTIFIEYPIESFSLSPDMQSVAIASDAGIHIWDLESNELLESFLVSDEYMNVPFTGDIVPNPSFMEFVSFSPQGDLIFGQTWWGSKFVWSVSDGEVLYMEYGDASQGNFTGVFSSDGELLIYGGPGGLIEVLEIDY